MGRVQIKTPAESTEEDPQVSAKTIIAQLKDAGIESFETSAGVTIQMTTETAQQVADVLKELKIHSANVRNDLLEALHREPAEKLIELLDAA